MNEKTLHLAKRIIVDTDKKLCDFPSITFKMKNKACYVLTVSRKFPTTHPKAGKDTRFPSKILFGTKVHTIRANYELWAKRIEKINRGEAYLSLRIWTGKPYRSEQREFMELTNVGIQKFELANYLLNPDDIPKLYTIAKNDGLTMEEFGAWFKNYKNEPMAIIHFTDFRYSE